MSYGGGFDYDGKPCLHPHLSEKNVEPMTCNECDMEFVGKNGFTSGEILASDREDVYDRRPAGLEE